MGPLLIHMYLVAALGPSLCSAAPVSGSLAVLVRSPVSVRRSHTTTLPCWLNPPQSAEGLEVRWYRPGHFDSPIMLYRAKKFENSTQEASYVGRVSFGSKDAASVGLKAGDVSLKLTNVTIEDEGEYMCYVSSDQGYDSSSVSLIVTETGASPLLSAVWKEENMVNVTCESQGWYPKPGLSWSDQEQVLTPKSLQHSKEWSGLLSVHSWLLVSSSSEVSCSVGLSGEEAKEARVHLEISPKPAKQESGSSVAGWVAFALLLIAVLAVLGVVCFKKRVKKDESERGDAKEKQELLPKEAVLPTDLSSKHYVNIKLDETGNQYLKIKDSILRDASRKDFPDGHNVTCLTSVKGTPGFSSGQHYWEVSMGNPTIGPKQSWWVGVTSAAVTSQEMDSTPTTSQGFWFLSSSPDRADTFQFSTEPSVLLPVYSRPQTVGVYLNYDSGELSFYNVEEKSLIGTLSAAFTGEVFPFFNPGKGDKAPMVILQRTEQGQCSDTVNSVDSTA